MTAVASPTDAVRCQSCGFEVEEATRRLEQADLAMQGLERELRYKRVRISELEGDNAKALTRHKKYPEAQDVLRHWGQLLAPKARELFSDSRVKPTLARLTNGHTVEGLKLCVDGYARFPYVVDGKRRSTGKPSQRHCEPHLIFRDPGHVEKGIEMARRGQTGEGVPTNWERMDWRKVQRANYREIIKALTEEAGEKPYEDPVSSTTHAECPKCRGALTVFRPGSGSGSLMVCNESFDAPGSGCDIDERTFFAALADDEA